MIVVLERSEELFEGLLDRWVWWWGCPYRGKKEQDSEMKKAKKADNTVSRGIVNRKLFHAIFSEGWIVRGW